MKLHLISMPVYDPMQPSSQTGYLQGYVENRFGDRVPVHSYPAHLSIFFAWKGADMRDAFNDHRLYGEELFYLACMHEFTTDFAAAYADYLAGARVQQRVSAEEIASLCNAVDEFVDATLLPQLEPDRLNVIGFTTTFAQLFASILAAVKITQRSNAPLLFIFGGASIAVPEHQALLGRWGVPGLLIQGPGEAVLGEVIDEALQLHESQLRNATHVIATKGIKNVSSIGVTQAIDLSYAKKEILEIPDPQYRDYFNVLRAFSGSDATYQRLVKLTSLPVEGSRGCFAKCDFCQNPNITSNFTTLKGEVVAERALRMAATFGSCKIFFADSVCNSWAEGYADRLHQKKAVLDAFMEMRVHAEEHFFTKLARVGVSELQLGVEALSEHLLGAMRKGTTVWQNLRAAKYLAELQIESASNLITHHPKSSLPDIDATKRVLSALPHFPSFSLSYFVVSYGSPLYFELDPDRQAQLERGFDWLREGLRIDTPNRDLAYPYPREWLDPALCQSWDDFLEWHRKFESARAEAVPSLTVVRRSADELVVERSIARTKTTTVITGLDAAVLDLCHAALKVMDVAARLEIDPSRADEIVNRLEAQGLVLRLGDRALSLPFRARAELLTRLTARSNTTPSSRLIPVVAA